MLDLVLAPVATADQVGDQLRLVDLVAGADADRSLLPRSGAETLHQGPARGHDHPWAVGRIGQPVQDP